MDEREAVQKRTPPRKLELTQADLPFLAGKPQSFLGLRDVVLLVEGVEVPVHSQVLAATSGVFCDLLLDFQGTYSSAEPVRLDACFRDKTLAQVMLFLAAAYGQAPVLGSVAEAQALVLLADEFNCPCLLTLALDWLRARGPGLMRDSCDEEAGVVKWALWAERFRLPDFQAEAEHRILCNFGTLQNDRRLAELSPQALLRILCGLHRTVAPSAAMLARAVSREELQAWAKSDRGWPAGPPCRQRPSSHIVSYLA